MLGLGVVQPTEQRMIGIARQQKQWYTRNIWRLWCWTEAKVEEVEVFVSLADTARLRRQTVRTDDYRHIPRFVVVT